MRKTIEFLRVKEKDVAELISKYGFNPNVFDPHFYLKDGRIHNLKEHKDFCLAISNQYEIYKKNDGELEGFTISVEYDTLTPRFASTKMLDWESEFIALKEDLHLKQVNNFKDFTDAFAEEYLFLTQVKKV